MDIKVLKQIKNSNDSIAEQNRELFKQKNVYVINVMGCSGSGKTETLVKTIKKLQPDIKIAVIAGDMCTTNDAERFNINDIAAIQVNTNEMDPHCYLAPHVIRKAVSNLDLDSIDLLFIENLGDLLCPPEYDLGENYKIIVSSVAEGENIFLKNPMMYNHCHAVALNKIDLLPYLDYDIEKARKNILEVMRDIPIFEISAKTEEGFDSWINLFKDLLKK